MTPDSAGKETMVTLLYVLCNTLYPVYEDRVYGTQDTPYFSCSYHNMYFGLIMARYPTKRWSKNVFGYHGNKSRQSPLITATIKCRYMTGS